jgi:hypothetical protein
MAPLIKADYMETVFTDVDADNRNQSLGCLVRHGENPFRVLCSRIGAN